ncbi:MAG TPA: FlgD immunoglobulin-like domain containing protein [Spirochaetota bacterium]|nr:FlgD immunoglobulin-like domain containing protein [Spirochaetota bacterium]HPF06048.1 FlgD immunoglobulin-like domain containing protein [Spirochaetota bacterium]HPJ42398.1 FlgD immunoglobulin-like domain containing protein [Spirochaetota bacterium]HPR38999.1 FlgD immunoglobulin-like domain containing protein [Spirochaetota bacterium]HRX46701.1 FlgD immunoglobulin-like domain containing protein [Spirochaetota bacterium]
MKLKLMIVLLLISVCNTLFAVEMDKIAAYPVPFNPKKHQRIIIGEPSVVLAGYNIKIEIFDINGDLVTKRTGSQFPVYWNGRNDSGRYVKPGMYIIKVVAENDNEYGRKTIRILVNY